MKGLARLLSGRGELLDPCILLLTECDASGGDYCLGRLIGSTTSESAVNHLESKPVEV